MHVSIRNNKGFSLVELMVVVAIIGILAAIAVPNFQRFSAKSKQSEAKANLSMLYASEASFYGEWQAYNSDLLQVGFRPQGTLHFRLTSSSANFDTTAAMGAAYSGPSHVAANLATSVAAICSGVAAGQSGCQEVVGTASIAGCAAPAGGSIAAMTATTYKASASGTLLPGGTVDSWSMTQFKVIQNDQSGLP